tara:strand:+ start:216 stop:614 length:399 start_codon:yes stop_codon:yes gene_type:complete
VKTFSVEIVTPINSISEQNVRYVRCPGLDGSFGVLKNHREGIIALGVGEVKIENENSVEWYATSGGFAEITSDKIELLLESIEKSNEIDIKRATKSIERAKKRMIEPQDKIDSVRLEASLARAINRLKVSKK